MKIFIDFDDVVFNTQRYKTDLKKIFFRFGISADLFERLYFAYPPNSNNSSVKTYQLEKHLQVLRKKVSFKKSELRKAVERFLADTKKYVFPDTVFFLNHFKKKQLFLISHGDRNFQRKKIQGSGLASYFQAVEITGRKKSLGLKKFLRKNQKEEPEKIFFLDDRRHYLEEAKRKFPSLISVLLQRPEGRYADQKNRFCDFEARNLRAALKVIQKNQVAN